MPSFKDNKGREWVIELNLLTIRPMKVAGFDIYTLDENRMAKLKQLSVDGDALAEWVWQNVKPQAEKLGIGFEEWIVGLNGDAVYSMREAFFDAYANFIPNPKMRFALQNLRDAEKKVKDQAAEIFEEATAKLIEMAQGNLQKAKAEMTPERIAALLRESNVPSSVSAASPA